MIICWLLQELTLLLHLLCFGADRWGLVSALRDVHGRVDEGVVGGNVFILVHIIVGVIDLTAAVDDVELLSALTIMGRLGVVGGMRLLLVLVMPLFFLDPGVALVRFKALVLVFALITGK